MAYNLTSFDGSTTPPNADYPWGDVLNDPNGTRVNKKMMADILQLFQKMMANTFITPSDTPDNVTNGYQLWDALNTQIFYGGTGPMITPLYSGTYIDDTVSPLRYRGGTGNMVVIRGKVDNSSGAVGIGTDQEVFVLDANNRPSVDLMFICADVLTPAPVYVSVDTAGSVKIMGTLHVFNNEGVYIDITFPRD